MCGIAYYSLQGMNGEQVAALEARARCDLAHRGPDASRIVVDDAALWAFHRLAVVHLGERGMQPLEGGAPGSLLVCNGEIWNYRDVLLNDVANDEVRSDCDAVLAALEGAWDHQHTAATAAAAAAVNAVARLDGDFAFVWRGGREECDGGDGGWPPLVAGRDRFGVRPLFVGTTANSSEGGEDVVRAFASEAKALVGVPGIDAVRVFPPGHIWVGTAGAAADGGMRGRYVPFVCTSVVKKEKEEDVLPLPPHHGGPPGEGAAAEQRPSCQRRPCIGLTADDLIPRRRWVAGTLEPRPPPVEPATAGPAHRVHELLREAVRKRLQHSERPVGVLCSGGIDSAIVTCVAARIVGRERLRVFTMRYAEGASEDAFYAELLCRRLGVAHTVLSFSRSDVADVYDDVVRAIETPDATTVRAAVPMFLLARRIAAETDVRVVLSGEGADELFLGYNYFARAPDGEAARDEAARLVRQLHMFDVLRADRCMSAAGLELRVPFLDAQLVEYVQGLPGRTVWSGTEKQLLRDAFSSSFEYPELRECRILDRGKERFSDGCGFSYVPQLLNAVSGGRSSRLDDKLRAERARVESVFDARYPGCRGLVVERTMPPWAAAGPDGDADSVLALT